MTARPVVKWAGGKTRLLEPLRAFMPKGTFGTYAEPFCGGAAMFFALAAERNPRFERAVLADKNEDLLALYSAIQGEIDELVDAARRYHDEHLRLGEKGRQKHYYAVRETDSARLSRVERGARLLFLNKTCFNGLWRVNAAGKFNVPFGRYRAPRICDEEVLRSAHRALEGVRIEHGDFTVVTRDLARGDFVYFDPPYAPVSKTSSFNAYARDRFDWAEQRRLAEELRVLRDRGVYAMLSNARTAALEDLYGSFGFHVDVVSAPRAINSDAQKRGDVDELVVTTYPAAPRSAAKRKAAS